jgi:uncharacterized protein YggE
MYYNFNMNKNNLLLIISISFTVIISAYILSKSSFSIRSTQTGVTKEGSLTNAISVSGDGTAIAKPDIVKLSISVSETAMTVKEAQENTNRKITQITEAAKRNGVKEDDIKTSRLSIRPKYEYENRRRVFKGHEANQTLNIEVSYSEKDNSAANIIDDVASIDEVQINSISFDVKDKKPLANEARELAYKSAEEKAQQLARLSGVKLAKPISIIDSSSQYNSRSYDKGIDSMMLEAMQDTGSSGSTQISGGELEHVVRINVVFGIE